MKIIGWAIAAFLFWSPVLVGLSWALAEQHFDDELITYSEGGDLFADTASTTITTGDTSSVDFYGPDQELIVRIRLDTKTIEYGPGYTPDAAAKVFWETLLHAPGCDEIYSLGEEQEETAHEQE
jgi:hypothetical protein